jgi:hypothetical protein
LDGWPVAGGLPVAHKGRRFELSGHEVHALMGGCTPPRDPKQLDAYFREMLVRLVKTLPARDVSDILRLDCGQAVFFDKYQGYEFWDTAPSARATLLPIKHESDGCAKCSNTYPRRFPFGVIAAERECHRIFDHPDPSGSLMLRSVRGNRLWPAFARCAGRTAALMGSPTI